MSVPLLGKLVKAFVGTDGLVDAADVEVASGGGVPAAGTAQNTAEFVAKLERMGPAWLFDSGTTEDPPFQSFRFNNADPDLATTIYIDRFSDSGRYDEFLADFAIGGYLYLQDQTTPADNILFRTTGTIVGSGGDSGWFEIPVTRVRSQFGTQVDTTTGDRWTFTFLPVGAVGSATRVAGSFVFNSRSVDATSATTFATSLSGITPVQGDAFRVTTGGEPFTGETINAEAGDVLLAVAASPNITAVGDWTLIKSTTSLLLSVTEAHFLEQVSEVSAKVFAADVANEVSTQELLFWLRATQVDNAQIDDPNVGLRVDEAQDGSFTQSTSSPSTILYIGIVNTYDDTNPDSTLQCVVTAPDGSVVQVLDLDSDFARATELSSAQFNYYRTTSALRGSFLGYEANQVVTVRRTVTQRQFGLTDAPVVGLTNNVENLPLSRLSLETRALLQSGSGLSAEQADLMTEFTVRDTTDTAAAQLQDTVDLRAKPGAPSVVLSDYASFVASAGLVSGTAQAQQWTVITPVSVTLTAMTGSISGTGTINEIAPSVIQGWRTWSVLLPANANAGNIFVPSGSISVINQWTLGDRVIISSDNLDGPLHDDIARSHQALDPALADLETHLTVAYTAGSAWTTPDNPTSLLGTLTRVFAAYWDEQRNGATPFVGNYFEDLADPTVTLSNGHNSYFANANDENNVEFPGKQSFFTGRLDISGAPLTNDFRKVIAFEHYIRDDNFTTDIPLLKAGTRRIIGIGPTGLHVRQGIEDGSPVVATFEDRLTAPTSTATVQYLRGVGANSIEYFVPTTSSNGTTIAFPLALTIRPKLVQGGVAGAGVTVAYTITDRATDQAQISEVVSLNVPAGSGGGTRDETLVIAYDGTTNVLTISTTGISTNTTQDVAQIGFEVTFNDSAQINSSTQSRDVPFHQQDEHRGRTVSIILLFQETSPFETSADKRLTVKAVVDGFEENDIPLNFPESAFDFSDLQFGPNSGDQIAISNIQIYDYSIGGSFANTPTHADLYNMWRRRSEWLGLFRAPARDYRQYTVDGGVILTDSDDTTVDVIDRIKTLDTTVASFANIGETVVYQATGTGTTMGELTNTFDLPEDYTDSQYLHIVQRRAATPIEWRMTVIPVALLQSADLGTDIIRIQGDSDVTFTPLPKRTVALTNSQVEIWRAALIRVVP